MNIRNTLDCKGFGICPCFVDLFLFVHYKGVVLIASKMSLFMAFDSELFGPNTQQRPLTCSSLMQAMQEATFAQAEFNLQH